MHKVLLFLAEIGFLVNFSNLKTLQDQEVCCPILIIKFSSSHSSKMNEKRETNQLRELMLPY